MNATDTAHNVKKAQSQDIVFKIHLGDAAQRFRPLRIFGHIEQYLTHVHKLIHTTLSSMFRQPLKNRIRRRAPASCHSDANSPIKQGCADEFPEGNF